MKTVSPLDSLSYHADDRADHGLSSQVLALLGSTDAQLYTGSLYFEGTSVTQDGVKAWEWFNRANITSNAPAAVRMIGLCYYKGRGVPRNWVKAAELFRRAATRGDLPAQAFLGFMLYKGQGVPVHYLEAVKLSKKAADMGDPNAQMNLGVIFQEGKAVTRHFGLAYQWFATAAMHPEMVAQVQPFLEFLTTRVRPDDVKTATENARKFRAHPNPGKNKY